MVLTALGSGLLSAGTSVLGGILGSIGQKKANETNMKINQMNNEFNERMLDKQLAFQEDMWNKTNEYNTAANQRKRLEEAGLNPYLMMSGGNAGTATAMSGGSASAASPIPMQNQMGAALQGASSFGSLANDVALSASEISNKNSLTMGNIINNDFLRERNRATLDEIYSRIQANKGRYKLDSVRAEYEDLSMTNRLYQLGLQNQLLIDQARRVRAVTALTGLQADSQKILNRYLDRQQQMEISERVARVAQLGQMMRESNAKIRLMAVQEVKTSCEAYGVKLRNGVYEQIATGMVNAINAENLASSQGYEYYDGESRARDFQQYNEWRNALIQQNKISVDYQNKRDERWWWFPRTSAFQIR